MKIIDLYELIANKEYDKLPNKIMLKGYDNVFTLREDCTGYKWYGEVNTHNDFEETIHQNLEFILNLEIIILDNLEEEKKIPEKLIPTSLKGIDNLDEKIEIAHIDTISVIETVNQLIDYLKSKGDE
jgi:hypothetical protein